MATAENPVQIRLPRELKQRIARIAKLNHLSESDVIRLSLAQMLPVIEEHGLTILPPGAGKAAAAA